jgi:hypothetical protein
MSVPSRRLAAVAGVAVAVVVVPPACRFPSFPHATSLRRKYSDPQTTKSTTKTQSYPPTGEAGAHDT